ncbi:MAG: sulfatase-like hydrolase/transferase, partial [Verrucomicrobiae bacterium]|nr:sulfatase-like hydrolase/transferase [Verrucomicrobiae bacterium]
MKQRIKWGFALLLLVLAGIFQMPAHAEERYPNLVFILVDDLGYGDLGCYGNTFHHTPHIDQLAAEGARFTRYYVTSPVCTPTRYALLTGKHPARAQMFEVLWPPTEGGMAPGEVTMAEWLKTYGYATGLAGKWHLGHRDPALLPPSQGFDDWYGMPYPNDMDADHVQAARQGGDWP